jgi:hypothetical protein
VNAINITVFFITLMSNDIESLGNRNTSFREFRKQTIIYAGIHIEKIENCTNNNRKYPIKLFLSRYYV